MHWSQASIMWGREDHPLVMPRPEGYALVQNPVMFSDTHTCCFLRVLIDGGSNINLLYRTSTEKLGIPAAQLKPSQLTFHGIVPVLSCSPWEGFSWMCCSKRRATSATSPSGSRWCTSAVHTMRYLAARSGQVHGSTALRVPQDEAPRPSRHDHHHGMLQEVDGVRKSHLEAGQGVGHR
jgi:hypothetical protein